MRDFAGNPRYQEPLEVSENAVLHGRVLKVEFKDGEVLLGSTMGFDLKRPGFFLFPADPQSNNVKVFVVSADVKTVLAADKPSALFKK